MIRWAGFSKDTVRFNPSTRVIGPEADAEIAEAAGVTLGTGVAGAVVGAAVETAAVSTVGTALGSFIETVAGDCVAGTCVAAELQALTSRLRTPINVNTQKKGLEKHLRIILIDLRICIF